MLNRKSIPKFYPPEFKPSTRPTNTSLSNGINVSWFNSGDQEVFKLELIFPVGSSTCTNPAIPSLCLDMLREGSKAKSAQEINSDLDYYGSFLNFNAGIDNTIITLFGRSVFAKKLIPLLAEIISNPLFDTEALIKHKKRIRQQLLINEEKTSYWAPRLLRKSIYGKNHPYSNLLSVASIDTITRDDLVDYHRNQFSCNLQNIIVAGSYDDKKFNQLLQTNFEGLTPKVGTVVKAIAGTTTVKTEVKKLANANQASLALGGPAINNKHQNFGTYAFMIKVLGGYFGSRLMKKLREEEGLTYGIHGFINHLQHGSYLQISADVEINSVDRSVELILAELLKLNEEVIPLNELDTVKNFMLGEFVNDSNTVFDFAELYKKLILQDLPEDYYQTFYHNISVINAEDIRGLALDNLQASKFSIIKVL
jgi:zinc protease